MQELHDFVQQAHQRGLHSQEIKELLIEAGWSHSDVITALYGQGLRVPVPPNPVGTSAVAATTSTQQMMSPGQSNQPLSVVQTVSTRGFEYAIMFFSLLASAFSLGLIIQRFIVEQFAAPPSNVGYDYYDDSGQGVYTFGVTVLLVTLPIFIVLFLRLKKAELLTPDLKKDASRRRMSHLTQFVAFLFGIGYIVYFVYAMINGVADDGTTDNLAKAFWQTLTTVVIAGSIFGYLWRDEHAANKE